MTYSAKVAIIVALSFFVAESSAFSLQHLGSNSTKDNLLNSLDIELRSRRQGNPNIYMKCAKVIVNYVEPDTKTYTMNLDSDMLNGLKRIDTSFALTPGRFTVEVKIHATNIEAETVNCDVNNADKWAAAPSSYGPFVQYYGKTEIYDFYVPTDATILVVCFDTAVQDVLDAAQDIVYNPVFKEVSGCASQQIGTSCDLTAVVAAVNKNDGKFESTLKDRDYIQEVRVSAIEDVTNKVTIDVGEFVNPGNNPSTALAGEGAFPDLILNEGSSEKLSFTAEAPFQSKHTVSFPIIPPTKGFQKIELAANTLFDEAKGQLFEKGSHVKVQFASGTTPAIKINDYFCAGTTIPTGGSTNCGKIVHVHEGGNNYFLVNVANSPALFTNQNELASGQIVDFTAATNILCDPVVGADCKVTPYCEGKQGSIDLNQCGEIISVQNDDKFIIIKESTGTFPITGLTSATGGRGVVHGNSNNFVVDVASKVADMYPATYKITLTAKGRENPDTSPATPHICNPPSSVSDNCLTSTYVFTTTHRNTAEVQIGALIAHSPYSSVKTIDGYQADAELYQSYGDHTYADNVVCACYGASYTLVNPTATAGTTGTTGSSHAYCADGEDKKALCHESAYIRFTVQDRDLFSSELAQMSDYTEQFDFSVTQPTGTPKIDIPMPSCLGNCKYASCPVSLTASDIAADGEYLGTGLGENDASFALSVSGLDASDDTFEVELRWAPKAKYICETAEKTNEGCSDGGDDWNVFRYYGITYCTYTLSYNDNTEFLEGRSDVKQDLDNLAGTSHQFIFASKPYSRADTAPYHAPQVKFSALPMRKFKSSYPATPLKKGKVTVEFTNRASRVLLGGVTGVATSDECPSGSIDTSVIAGSNLGAAIAAGQKLCCTAIQNMADTVLKVPEPNPNPNPVGVCKNSGVACETTESGQNLQRTGGSCDVCQRDFEFYVHDHVNGAQTTKPFGAGSHQLCIVMTGTMYPFKEEATILENTIEIASTRSRRDNAVDNEVDMFVYDRAQRQDGNNLLQGRSIFLDIDEDMTMTVRIGNDDNGDTEVVIETQTQQNGDIVDDGDSTTVPLVETPANKGMTTTLLGLIVGAILVLLVIVIVAIMMLKKRQETAPKVYPFWMPGTDVSSTAFVKSTQA